MTDQPAESEVHSGVQVLSYSTLIEQFKHTNCKSSLACFARLPCRVYAFFCKAAF